MDKKIRYLIFVSAIFLLGLGTSQLASLIKSSLPIKTTKPIEITAEATTTSRFNQPGSGDTVAVSRVIDGDTVELADGRKVRYIGIDTPELVHPQKPVECFAKEAKAENQKLVEGKAVRLEKDISETDKYGRLLRYVYIDNLMVNDYLVRQGFAYASTYPPDVAHQQQLLVAVQEARGNQRGLWGRCQQHPTNPATELGTSATDQPEQTSVMGTGTTGQCVIKGNVSSSGEKIYHLPGCGSYAKTVIDESKGERWFCSEEEAVKAGWRKAKNC